MRKATITATAILLATGGAFTTARADSTTANCAVREDGKVKEDASGPCELSQRQGYVDIKLKNGFTHALSPAGDSANEYEDAKGHKVERSLNGENQVYKWDDKKIVVSFGAGSGESGSSGGGKVGEPAPGLQDLVHGKLVGGEVEDELAKRGWKQGKTDVEGDDVYSHFYKGDTCVVVRFGKGRHVESIANGMMIDCKQ
jgi:hypothetical protein